MRCPHSLKNDPRQSWDIALVIWKNWGRTPWTLPRSKKLSIRWCFESFIVFVSFFVSFILFSYRFRTLLKFLPSGMISMRSCGISTADSAIPFWISSMLNVPSCRPCFRCLSVITLLSQNLWEGTIRGTPQDDTMWKSSPFPNCATVPLLVFVEDKKRVAQLLQVFVLQLLSDQRQRHLVVTGGKWRIDVERFRFTVSHQSKDSKWVWKCQVFAFENFAKRRAAVFFSSDHDVPHFFRSLRLRLFRFGCSVFRSRAFFMRDPSLKRFKFLHLNTKIHASTYSQTREKIRWKKMSSSSAKEQVFWRFAFGSLATHTGWTHSDASKRKHKQSDPNRWFILISYDFLDSPDAFLFIVFSSTLHVSMSQVHINRNISIVHVTMCIYCVHIRFYHSDLISTPASAFLSSHRCSNIWAAVGPWHKPNLDLWAWTNGFRTDWIFKTNQRRRQRQCNAKNQIQEALGSIEREHQRDALLCIWSNVFPVLRIVIVMATLVAHRTSCSCKRSITEAMIHQVGLICASLEDEAKVIQLCTKMDNCKQIQIY